MSVYVGESRGELIAWMNELLAPQEIKKLEQCGTGSVYCQIIDSIYGDVALQRVKFNAKQEYEYLENFKVLQKAFNAHQIDKPIPVDRLIKCKMQDNLEFLQWMKKYWDAHSRGDFYDAAGRAGGVVMAAPSTSSSRAAAASTRPAASASRPAARAPAVGRAGVASAPGGPGAARVPSVSQAQMQQLTAQVEQMEINVTSLEKERDFYFDKLRNIEMIVKERLDALGEEQSTESETLLRVQEILYQTEEGFEAPEAEEGEGEGEVGELIDEVPPEDEEETF